MAGRIGATVTYILVKWKHTNPEYPILLYSELDDNRWEIRKVEVHADSRIGFASRNEAVGGTFLGKTPVPPMAEIAADLQFEPIEISAREFEHDLFWCAGVHGKDIRLPEREFRYEQSIPIVGDLREATTYVFVDWFEGCSDLKLG